ncbi:MAG: sigma-54-dependent Fis family transcriptional regulator [Pseudomonadales bacterium]|nr:sigma-54-dependent Fis family transcriptional regulator [Pseudomonadales bacterium]
MPTILVIDDNEGVCTALQVLFSLHDIDVVTASSPRAGLGILESRDVELVIQDMNFTADTTSGAEGETLFNEIRGLYPALPIILLTAWTHLEAAVQLVKEGAADYLSKPWDDDKLVTTVRNLLQLQDAESARREMIAESRKARRSLEAYELCGAVFESHAMTQAVELAIRVARADVPVLVTGPNGAGKEKIAEIIHANSGREGALVKVNVGALPTDLIESELFGSEQGAFTGAQKRAGRFERADGGTLFLDEIGNLPHEGQVKLLRVLQTGEFERLGGSETRKADVRLVTATNADLSTMIREGTFREDLFYRINVIELRVPSLNERAADILPLAHHFLGAGKHLSPDAQERLVDYHWPGNVRELENCMKRAALLAESDEITASQLGLDSHAAQAGREPGKAEIQSALDAYSGVVSRAAKSLGLSRQALYRRMEKYGLK